MAAVPFQIKFAHLHGGEKTLGAIDNIYRHAISHASAIHFTSTVTYRNRLGAMLDVPENVYHVGALSLDNLSSIPLLTIPEFKANWQIDLSRPTILMTFHPETVNADANVYYAEVLVEVMRDLKEYQFLVTLPNADTAGSSIRKIFADQLSEGERIFLIENLGTQSYFTAMRYCSFLLGNTSSGIIEAASFGKYVINVGKRQEGRDSGENVIQSAIAVEDIKSKVSLIQQVREYSGPNIYFNNGAADAIVDILKAQHFNE
jgi:GDP/UDP-N,N'-diacetylbacillosamine 2-epimerase (hydrolysing)